MTRPCSILSTRRIIDLKTGCVCPPIPTRRFDWAAYDDNTLDAPGSFTTVIGRGETESEAISDLFDQMEEQ